MMETAERSAVRAKARTGSAWLRRLGTLLLVAGIGMVAWAGVVWQWNDPFTSAYTWWEQRQLESEYAALAETYAPPPIVLPTKTANGAPTPSLAPPAAQLRKAATKYRANAPAGGAIGRLVIPRLGVDMVFVNGTDSATLKKGPGLHPTTFMPGQGELVYIAGHRTTYGAPFAKIDEMRPGDRFTIEMPYGTFAYQVTGHRIVDDQDLSVLQSQGHERVALQACHPRFFATERYIVWAKPVGIER